MTTDIESFSDKDRCKGRAIPSEEMRAAKTL